MRSRPTFPRGSPPLPPVVGHLGAPGSIWRGGAEHKRSIVIQFVHDGSDDTEREDWHVTEDVRVSAQHTGDNIDVVRRAPSARSPGPDLGLSSRMVQVAERAGASFSVIREELRPAGDDLADDTAE
jgi:hypothetical protein